MFIGFVANLLLSNQGARATSICLRLGHVKQRNGQMASGFPQNLRLENLLRKNACSPRVHVAERPALASVRTLISCMPFARKVCAISCAVAPVVITSSTSKSVRCSSRRGARTAKAPCSDCCRACASNPPRCGSVALVRMMAVCKTGKAVARDKACARISA